MKLILTILLFSLGFFSSLSAQQNRSNTLPGVQYFIIQYGDALNITDQQKSELITLQVDRRTAMQSERQSGRLGQQQRAVRGQQRAVRGQQRAVRGQQRAVRGQQRAVRGPLRGTMRPDLERNRRDLSSWAESRSDHREAIMDILNDEQKARYHEIQNERVENRTEVLMLQNRTLVERTITDSNKAEEVIGMLNRITEIQKENQLYRIENAGDIDSEKMVENVTEIRSIQDELMSKITVAEYRTLRPAFAIGQRQRPGGRGTQWNR